MTWISHQKQLIAWLLIIEGKQLLTDYELRYICVNLCIYSSPFHRATAHSL